MSGIGLGAAIILLLVAAGCGGGSTARFKWSDEDAGWSPSGKLIAFVSNRAHPRANDFQLYEMEANGRATRRLKLAGSGDDNPRFSPDGNTIAYSSDPRNAVAGDLDLIRSNGQDRRTLASRIDPGIPAAWSPNGRWIAFARPRSSADQNAPLDLWLIWIAGRRERRIARNIDPVSSSSSIAWSRDGSRIAFGCFGGDLCVVGLRGRPRRLTHQGRGDRAAFSLSWSPDGERIAFVRGTFGPLEGEERDEAWVIDVNRHSDHHWRLGGRGSLAWLPGHSALLAASGPGLHVYLVRADGSGRQDLQARGNASDGDPIPSPDGRALMFTRFGPIPSGDADQRQELVVAALPSGHFESATQARN